LDWPSASEARLNPQRRPPTGWPHTHATRQVVSKSWNQLDTKGLSNFCVRNGQILIIVLKIHHTQSKQSSQTAQTLCGQAHCVWGGLGARAHCSQELVFFKRALLIATSSFVWPASEWRSEGWWRGQTGGGEVLAAVGTRVECCHAATTERQQPDERCALQALDFSVHLSSPEAQVCGRPVRYFERELKCKRQSCACRHPFTAVLVIATTRGETIPAIGWTTTSHHGQHSCVRPLGRRREADLLVCVWSRCWSPCWRQVCVGQTLR
jgi:hypothetical protein